MPSAFASNKQKTILIPGIDEEITIRSLSSAELASVPVSWFRTDSPEDNYYVDHGIVSIGEMSGETGKNWSGVLTAEATKLIGEEIRKLTRE